MAAKVLIIEDDSTIRGLVRLILQEGGYEIYEAEDGVVGLEMVRSLKPDLLILDVMLPGKNGYQICEELRSDPLLSHAYVIFVSGRSSKAAELAALEAGGDLLIPKPFTPDKIRQAVKNGLAKPNST